MKQLEDYLRDYAQSSPMKIALQNAEGSLTYNELWTAVCDRATELLMNQSSVSVTRANQGFDFVICRFSVQSVNSELTTFKPDSVIYSDGPFCGITNFISP